MTNEEEFLMLNLFERTLDLVCITNRAGWFQKVNPAVIKTLGYSEDELFSQPVSILIHPDDREATRTARNKLLNNEPLINFQNRYIAKDGNTIWLQWTSIYIPEKEIVFAIAKDVTKKKQSEIEIEENFKKYKELATHFKQHVEKDRRFFASELHEELAQLATVVKMNFAGIEAQKDRFDDIVKKRIDDGLEASQLLIDKIRKLSYSMNPARIEEIGLDAALRSLSNDFLSTTGIKCIYKSSFEEQEIESEIKLDLFRICQEALLNVMQHAQATKVSISIKQKRKKLELTVKDNGKGFEQQTLQSFGLKDIRGRAASIGGELIIESKKSKGTKLSLTVNTRNEIG